MELAINWAAVAVAAILGMILGSIWYSPRVFGTYWMRVASVNERDMRNPVLAIFAACALTAFSSFGLAIITSLIWQLHGGESYLLAATCAAAIVWGLIACPRMLTHTIFEGRPAGLMVLNVAFELVTFVLMAAVIGFWAPASTA